MRFTIAAVGKPRDADLAAVIREYETRVARYWPVNIVEVRAEPARDRTPAEVRAREAERLRAALPKGAGTWLCDATGKAQTSEDFAKWMQRTRESARDVGLVIGGAFGIDSSFAKTAAGKLSLGPMTLSHDLARLVLAEQMYRAGTIIRGEPYHK
jgi:23S rRNA (pseudouridine1915-N3)-methyltransferase